MTPKGLIIIYEEVFIKRKSAKKVNRTIIYIYLLKAELFDLSIFWGKPNSYVCR